MGEAFLFILTILGGILFIIGMIGGAINGWKSSRAGKNLLENQYRLGWDDTDDDDG